MKFVIQNTGKQMLHTIDKLVEIQLKYNVNSLSDIVLKFADIHSMLEDKFPKQKSEWYDEQAFVRLHTYYKAYSSNR